MQEAIPYHVPVMLDAVIQTLNPQPGQTFVDATLGAGGHAFAVAQMVQPSGRLIGIDRDLDAHAEAASNLAQFGKSISFAHERFDNVGLVLDGLNIELVNGVLFDLGVSSHQLDVPERGFSFKDPDALLDMRMDGAQNGETAADLLNRLSERDLSRLIRENSDERWAARIASYVVQRRVQSPFKTVGQLVEAVHAAIPVAARPPDKHAATRTFQALRIEVNDELSILGNALQCAFDRLTLDGVLAVLTYHSLEDRIVKKMFGEWCGKGDSVGPYGARPTVVASAVHKKPLVATDAEVSRNPRARSAKLRAIRKLVGTSGFGSDPI